MKLIGIVSLFYGISAFMGYSMSNRSLKKISRDTIWPITMLAGGHTFPKSKSQLVWLVLELAFFGTAVQYCSHYTTETGASGGVMVSKLS